MRTSNVNRSAVAVTLFVGSVLIGGAGGSDRGFAGSPDSARGAQGQVAGTVFAPNGTLPIAGARVYAPLPSGASKGAGTPETTSDINGRFLLTQVPTGKTRITVSKGEWTKSFEIQVSAGVTANAPVAATTLLSDHAAGAPKIALIKGYYDPMENFLAKLGLGKVDGSGKLVSGSAKFDMYDGDLELKPWDLLEDSAKLAKYDILLISCAAMVPAMLAWEDVAANLKKFVQGGGKLYVTDHAYDIIEQTYPEAVDFAGSVGTPVAEPEEEKVAKLGDQDIKSKASVTTKQLSSWLSARGALNDDGTVTLEGFGGGWAVIEAPGAGTAAWVSGPITYQAPALSEEESETGGAKQASGTKPLTISFARGKGRVLFSSYHSHKPSPTLTQQELILAYFIFEM